MRFASNRDSVRRGEVSVLAVIETIAATGISFWLAWHFGTIQHFVIASAVAPLLLLRTPLSTWYAAWLSIHFGRAAKHRVPADFGPFVEVGVETLSIPVAKLISTVYMTVRRPVRALSAIPTNFVKNVLAIDLAYSPQFIPGVEETRYRHRFSDRDTYTLLREVWAEPLDDLLERGVIVLLFVPAVLSAIAYRWAIKSTAILWLPLIWVVVQSRSRDIFTCLAVVARSYKGRMMLGYSIFVAGAFLVKLTLLFGFWRLHSFASFGPLGTAGTQLIDPVRLPLWQAAAAFNAVLASVYFFQADVHLHKRGTAEAWPEKWLKREYSVVTATRWIISLYTIACTFYIVSAVAWNMQWPTIQVIPFPWEE